MRKVFRKRLLNVAKALIDEARWRKKNPPRGPEDRFRMTDFTNPCGSPACALGTYASRRDLQRAFALKRGVRGVCMVGKDGKRFWLDGATELAQLNEHFGLNVAEAQELFDDIGCNEARTEHEAAAYIRAFVKRKEREARNV